VLASLADYKLMPEQAPAPGPGTFSWQDYDIMLFLINYPSSAHEGIEEVHEQSDQGIK
jgi:hypothetical protein